MFILDYFSTEVLKGSKKEFKKSLLLNYLLYIPFIGKTKWLKKEINNLPSKQVIIKNKIGKFFIYTNNDTIRKSWYLFENNVRDWLSLDTKRNIFLDVGANIGFYTILANKLGFNQIIAFEPNQDIFKMLEQNVELNEILNADLNNTGLDCTQRNISFHKCQEKTGSSKFLLEDDFENYDKKNIMVLQTISFDKYVNDRKLNVKNISFIKIDVEGFENNVLKGMEKTLDGLSLKTKIFIEIWNKNSDSKIIDLLKTKGFILINKIDENYLFEKKM